MAEQLGELIGGKRKAVGRGQAKKLKGERNVKLWVAVSVGTEDGGGGEVVLSDATVSDEWGTWRRRDLGRFLATPRAGGSVCNATETGTRTNGHRWCVGRGRTQRR